MTGLLFSCPLLKIIPQYFRFISSFEECHLLISESFLVLPNHQGARLKEATKADLDSIGLDSIDAKDIIEKRDALLLEFQPILRMGTADAADEVATFDTPMVNWGVQEVLRLINSLSSGMFDAVKEKCLEIRFDGKLSFSNHQTTPLLLLLSLSFH